jgi:hypothetical protein
MHYLSHHLVKHHRLVKTNLRVFFLFQEMKFEGIFARRDNPHYKSNNAHLSYFDPQKWS